MTKIRIFTLITFLLASSLTFGAEVKAKIKLSPMGSFEAKSSKIVGKIQKSKKGIFVAKNISVEINSLATGIELRDKHLKEKLEFKKFPKIILEQAKANGSKGVGILKIKNIRKKIQFTTKVSGKNILINFSIKLSDYKITKIKYLGVGVSDEVKIEASLPIN